MAHVCCFHSPAQFLTCYEEIDSSSTIASPAPATVPAGSAAEYRACSVLSCPAAYPCAADSDCGSWIDRRGELGLKGNRRPLVGSRRSTKCTATFERTDGRQISARRFPRNMDYLARLEHDDLPGAYRGLSLTAAQRSSSAAAYSALRSRMTQWPASSLTTRRAWAS